MKIRLTPYEARVIGALIEKEITTPEQYPLSLNALVNACNQKSNRDPVMDLDEDTIQATVDGLIKRYLASSRTGHGVRVPKYLHRFCNSEFGVLKLSAQAVAILCELLLRGPQTPGELRGRAERLCKFGDVGEVEATLANLMERDEPLVARLPREAGKRENRYAHLLGESQPVQVPPEENSDASPPLSDHERLAALERQVHDLSQELARLRQQFQQWSGDS